MKFIIAGLMMILTRVLFVPIVDFWLVEFSMADICGIIIEKTMESGEYAVSAGEGIIVLYFAGMLFIAVLIVLYVLLHSGKMAYVGLLYYQIIVLTITKILYKSVEAYDMTIKSEQINNWYFFYKIIVVLTVLSLCVSYINERTGEGRRTQISKEVYFCRWCGNKIRPNDIFCGKCGKKILR